MVSNKYTHRKNVCKSCVKSVSADLLEKHCKRCEPSVGTHSWAQSGFLTSYDIGGVCVECHLLHTIPLLSVAYVEVSQYTVPYSTEGSIRLQWEWRVRSLHFLFLQKRPKILNVRSALCAKEKKPSPQNPLLSLDKPRPGMLWHF